MRVALVGGSFNPPHIAHFEICDHLFRKLKYDQVWLIPCAKHQFKINKDLAPFDDRVNMCMFLVDIFTEMDIGKVKVSKVEGDIAKTIPKPGTIDLIEYLKKNHPLHDFTFIIGGDIPKDFDKWKEAERLKKEVKFLVFERLNFDKVDGWDYFDSTTLNISSSDIRKWLAEGINKHHVSLDCSLIDGTFDYIMERGLYGMEKREKKYCNKCRYVRVKDVGIQCYYPKNVVRYNSNHFSKGKRGTTREPYRLNKNNTCKWYEEGNPFRKFWTWLKNKVC